MIKIKITNKVVITNLPKNLYKRLKNDLTFKNPKFYQERDAGRYYDHLNEYFFYYQRKGNKIKCPKGYLHILKKLLDRKNVPYEFEDKTLSFDKMDIHFKGDKRDYQVLAVKDVLKYPSGVLEGATGSGKTVMGIQVIAERKQPTLVIVHTKELLYQWKEQIKQFLNYDAGLIGDGHCIVKPITVGIINSVKTRTKELKKLFGHVIVDECHRVPGETWTDTLIQFHNKYTLGLSATAFRRDGLGKAIYAFIGPRMHKVSIKKLQEDGAVLIPKVYRVMSHFRYYYRDDYQTMISELTKNHDRNSMICELIKKDHREYREPILVVSDRVGHCKELSRMLKEMGMKSEVLSGSVPKDKREKIIEKVKENKVHVLISTLSLIGEGFDAPGLCALFLTTPVKFAGRIIQVVGRILRPKKGKVARLYDIRDNVGVLLGSGKSRDAVYKNQWG